jgi:hypothetical protein
MSVILSILGCIALAGGLLFVIRMMAPRPETLPVTPDWIEELSLDRYRPMLRLTDLLKVFDGMRVELRTLVPANVMAGA